VFLVDYGGMDLLEMANTRGKRPSPDARPRAGSPRNSTPTPLGVSFLRLSAQGRAFG
jgi:hypothetical protein